MKSTIRRCRMFALLAVSVLPVGLAWSQPPAQSPALTGFLPGAQRLFVLDLANTPVGEIPTSIKLLQGTLEVVLKDGVPMLKASSASAFLIMLPQPLPQDFTLEFDLVPKACCNPADLGIGEVNQGAASAHLEWDSDGQLRAVGGGGELYQAPMPEDFRAALPGVRTQVGVSFQGTTVKLYTNGRRLFTLDRQFARKRELRISLGGQDDRAQAVYLAGLRIATGGPLIGIVQTTPQPGPRAVTPATPAPAPGAPSALPGPSLPVVTQPGGQQTMSNSQASTGGTLPTVVANVTVIQGTAGPVVNWLPVSVPASYSVRRWKIDDAVCCNNVSPPAPTLTGPPWQDAPLPVSGTYVYEVTATMAGGVASGQAQFIKFGSGGSIAGIAPPPTTVTAVPASQPSGTATPISPTSAPVLPAPSSLPTLAPAPPPAPTVTAPIATAPRAGGASGPVLGPATLIASPMGWGANLSWPEVVGGVEYQVERSPTGQTFAAFATIQTQYQRPQAGTFSRSDQTVQPGSTTFYRVRAVLSDGTLTPYSPVARHDAPTQVPYVSNLTTLQVYSGPLSANGPLGYRGVRWGWASPAGAIDAVTVYAIQIDLFARDATGALIPVSGGSTRTASSRNLYEADLQVTSGNSVRLCISVVFPPSTTDPLQYAVCQMTAIP